MVDEVDMHGGSGEKADGCSGDTAGGGAEPRCPSCESRTTKTIYLVPGIPVHSCILMGSRREALEYPRGDLELRFCGDCGFVFNAAFDPSLHEYSTKYEDTQGYSPTFNAFAESLARRLLDRWDLRGKTVLEIGCGKGEFLVQLCELGECRGIGLDPSYVPGRLPDQLTRRVEFIRDFYGPAYAHLRADLICCRHTLEHIDATGKFVADVRRAIGDHRETLVFFEVPDVLRVLREGAFWDLYYEHCSYFSPGSQARLFRRHGFDVTELELDYADQYVLQMARLADGSERAALDLENDLDALRQAAARFPMIVADAIHSWHAAIDQATARGERVVLWGSGSKGVAFLTTLGLENEIRYAVDINPHKHGKFMPGTGQEIVAPEFLREYRPDLVIVMNSVYMREIRTDLRRLGVEAEVRAV